MEQELKILSEAELSAIFVNTTALNLLRHRDSVHPALNTTGPSPVCCHFSFSVPRDGVTAADLGVGDVSLHTLIPGCGASTKPILVTPSCWCYCLLPLPAVGDRQHNSAPVFGGQTVVVARSDPGTEPPLLWHNHCLLKIHGEKVL